MAELSDLSEADRNTCMAVVAAVERVLREQLEPTKINLAALGNMVAHLHWHVIARYDWDSHFPASVWASPSACARFSARSTIAARTRRLRCSHCAGIGRLGLTNMSGLR